MTSRVWIVPTVPVTASQTLVEDGWRPCDIDHRSVVCLRAVVARLMRPESNPNRRCRFRRCAQMRRRTSRTICIAHSMDTRERSRRYISRPMGSGASPPAPASRTYLDFQRHPGAHRFVPTRSPPPYWRWRRTQAGQRLGRFDGVPVELEGRLSGAHVQGAQRGGAWATHIARASIA